MMTPKEVQEHGFPRSRKGYDMAEVDDFLDKLTEDYTALYTNYGKLSNNYAKLRKKAQALAAALEQSQDSAAAKPVSKPAPKPAVQVTAASQDAVDELLRTARKDAEAIRAGAERERQEIIEQATSYAAEHAEQLKAEIAQEEARLANLRKSTAEYVRQVRQLVGRQTALLDSMPVEDGDLAPAAETVPAQEGVDEPTVRVEEHEADVVGEITRNMMSMGFDDESLSGEVPEKEPESSDELDDMDTTGSLFDAITGADSSEFDEE